jgi:hypothetical protein
VLIFNVGWSDLIILLNLRFHFWNKVWIQLKTKGSNNKPWSSSLEKYRSFSLKFPMFFRQSDEVPTK